MFTFSSYFTCNIHCLHTRLQAECCSDHLHCCYEGTLCDLEHSKCVNKTHVLDWVERVAAKQVTRIPTRHEFRKANIWLWPHFLSLLFFLGGCGLSRSGVWVSRWHHLLSDAWWELGLLSYEKCIIVWPFFWLILSCWWMMCTIVFIGISCMLVCFRQCAVKISNTVVLREPNATSSIQSVCHPLTVPPPSGESLPPAAGNRRWRKQVWLHEIYFTSSFWCVFFNSTLVYAWFQHRAYKHSCRPVISNSRYNTEIIV